MTITFHQKIKDYLVESYKELRKVSWPTKQETTNHTIAIIGISLGMAVFLGSLDYFFSRIFEQFIK